MPRNGSGTYTLPAGNPVVTGTTISSTVQNNTMSDVATALTNSIAKDGQTTPTANLPMGTYRHTGVGNGVAATDYAALGQVQNSSAQVLASVSGADTITAVASPTLSAYATGQTFRFVTAGANTGPVTINIDSLGAKSITKQGSTALAAGDLPSGAVVEIVYDGTRFQAIGVQTTGASAADIQKQTYTYFTTGGTSTAYTLTPTPAISANTAGTLFFVNFNAAAGATPTLAVSGLTALSLKYFDSTGAKQAVTSTQIPSGWKSAVITDGTDWIVTNVPPVGAATTSASGIVELATDAEVQTGTSTTLVPSVSSMRNGMIVLGTSTATTSGTSIDFTGIPSWVKRITIMFDGFSTSSTSIPMIQLGDSGGIENTGYNSQGQAIDLLNATSTTGFIISGSWTAASIIYGQAFLSLKDASTNTWSFTSMFVSPSNTAFYIAGGSKALSATLDRIRITTVNGTDTFDAGSINIQYQ